MPITLHARRAGASRTCFFSLCINSLLPAGMSRGASAKALRWDTCSQQKMLTRVPQTEEVLVRGRVARGAGAEPSVTAF